MAFLLIESMYKSHDLRLNGHSINVKIRFFSYIVFNKDTSLNISLISWTFSTHIDEEQMQGSVSQIFFLGPSFYFIKSRKLNLKK